ncbi:class I SAM-dependent methyltransferase [Rhodocytophaga rosea]|uniref:Class I SAM-dependent methyltransferase n=1 Tax=Rhodocytophaga rosea TaxID=2704465 RepID=A0A6C0GL34_9BACT|nr:class I SAM-dependent methyltransferase [Rhodocytophaga rosea]QHT68657.1 class I SAM-dependent methyltransferase [Rhodocytophaga rosea]
MKVISKPSLYLFIIFCSIWLSQAACGQKKKAQTQEANDPETVSEIYQNKPSQSPDGTGKYYMEREIAQVMGHTGAEWLERPEREQEERTDALLEALSLQKDDVVADIGAGTGYFTFRMSPLVPQGKVLAVDIQQEMIDLLETNKVKNKAPNVETVLGTFSNPKLPAGSVDLVLMVDAYHEFSHPREMMEVIATALKPGGRVALVEYRAEDPNVPIRPRHKMTVAQAQKEMEAVGLKWIQTSNVLPQQHLMFFQKPKD